jgi:hypothetical protein
MTSMLRLADPIAPDGEDGVGRFGAPDHQRRCQLWRTASSWTSREPPPRSTAVIEEMGLNGRLPAHALYHGAGSPDGRDWRVVDVWETPEDFERFAAEKIGPITARHGIGEPRITSFPIHEIRRGDPEPVTFPARRPPAGG